MMPSVEERLQKVLARAGLASRRGAEELIQEGRVTVNGAVVRELGTKADSVRDDVRVDGVRVRGASAAAYLVLNKPRGVVTTRRDPAGRPTVMDLVPGMAGLFPVGRLDVTTEGLILLTNDGAFAERVAHPRYEVPRVYHAKVRGLPDVGTLERLRRGIRVEGERLKADGVRVLEAANNAWVEIVLHEGKQHEVKRLLEAVGHPVAKLRRVAIGPVVAPDLQPGQFRTLRAEEIAGLMRGAEGPRRPLGRPSRRPRYATRRRARRPPAPAPRGGRGGGRRASPRPGRAPGREGPTRGPARGRRR
jgi:23S rRNA pseudouridine2605 synthase